MHPALYGRLEEQMGSVKAQQYCQLMMERATLSVRVNLAKTTRARVRSPAPQVLHAHPQIQRPEIEGPAQRDQLSFESSGELIRIACTTWRSSGWGFSRSRMRGPPTSAPKSKSKFTNQPGDNVLDFCAGAGGKSLALAERMDVDSSEQRPDFSARCPERGSGEGKRTVSTQRFPKHSVPFLKARTQAPQGSVRRGAVGRAVFG